MSNLRLRTILTQFLTGDPNLFYPPIETRILQFNPLQITDDYETYIDLSALQDEVFDQVVNQDLGYKLILNNWNFIFKRVPNSHDYYFDIHAENYQIIEVNTLLELETFPYKITDCDDVRYFFEARKRNEIEDLIRRNMRIKTSPFKRLSSQVTPAKSVAFSKSSPHYFRSPSAYSHSGIGYPPNPYHRPQYPASMSLQGGVKKPSVVKQVYGDEILTIEDLLDIPEFIVKIKPVMKKKPSNVKHSWPQSSNITPMKTMHTAATTDLDEQAKSSIRLVSMGHDSNKSTPSLASRTAKALSYNDISDALKSGMISWGDLTFNRQAFNYLQKNVHIMDK